VTGEAAVFEFIEKGRRELGGGGEVEPTGREPSLSPVNNLNNFFFCRAVGLRDSWGVGPRWAVGGIEVRAAESASSVRALNGTVDLDQQISLGRNS
jgi:hypothetical protein